MAAAIGLRGDYDAGCESAWNKGSDAVLMKVLFMRGPSRGLGGDRGFRGRTSGV
jgi:hypothetical protein